MLSLIHEKMNFGVNMTKTSIIRSVNIFENNAFLIRSVNFFENLILRVRSVSFFENIIFLVRSVNMFENIIFWVRSLSFFENIIFGSQKCKLSLLRPHANFQFFSVNHVFECLIDGFRSWEGRNRHRMDLL